MFKTILLVHTIVVIIFLFIYLIKTALLLSNNFEKLQGFTKAIKVPEIIVSVLFLVTGGYMLMQLPEINTLMIVKLIAVFASIPLAVVGFKKKNKLLATLSLLLLVGAYGLAEMSSKQQAKAVAPVNGPTATGAQEVYTAYCTKCHGDDGKLGLVGASDLSATKLDDTEITTVVTHGKGSMPAFEESLTPEQIKGVVDYLHTLKK